jgi:hypothetical protein
LAWDEAKWRQKSRAVWLAKDDENTKFFHNYAKMRKNSNIILDIQKENGEKVYKFNEIAEVGTRHFKNLYQEP